LAVLPLAGVAAAGVGFWAMLSGMRHGSFDPHDIHAPVLDRAVPAFDLPGVGTGAGFSSQDLRGLTQPVLVNFFASWCIPCVAEAPLLVALGTRLPIWGIAYKDKPDDAAGFVARTSAPYARLAADRSGMTAIDWGVSGVPESFLIRPGGIIAWHVAGALTPELITETVLPLAGRLAR
jgi:cytochrome c biogenesis protein CcmG/thiol:disulfide interchange protein DsbE